MEQRPVCKDCTDARVTANEMMRDRRQYMHCQNEKTGHRCGWIVHISSENGKFGDTYAPVWCPVQMRLGVDPSQSALRAASSPQGASQV